MATAAWVQAGATVVLVLVTLSYVRETRRTARQEQTNRKRDAVVQAATRALRALQEPCFDETSSDEISADVCLALRHTLELEEPFIGDSELQTRMRACSGVAFACVTELNTAISPYTGRESVLLTGKGLVRRVVNATRASLEANLTEKPLPAWNDLPSPTNVSAWVADGAKSLDEG